MKKFTVILMFSVLIITFKACKEDNPPANNNANDYKKGVLVSNEGPFQSGSGTISFISNTGSIENEIFLKQNNRPLGNVVQSVTRYDDHVYIVVNNAGKVEVADPESLKSLGSISGLSLPRYILGISSGKIYISQWGSTGMDGSVQIINTDNLSMEKSLRTGRGTEQMILHNDKVFVVNSGGFGYDSTLIVIDAITDKITDTLIVGPNPNSLQLDENNKLWVLCGGKWNSSWTALEEKGRLVKIDPVSLKPESIFEFSSEYSTPTKLAVNKAKDRLFFVYNEQINKHEINSAELDETAFIKHSAYGLGIDPDTEILYIGDPGDYVNSAKVFRYTMSGNVIDSFDAGILPNAFAF